MQAAQRLGLLGAMFMSQLASVSVAGRPGSNLLTTDAPRGISGHARNLDCPCGSGKKRKHCHAARAA